MNENAGSGSMFFMVLFILLVLVSLGSIYPGLEELNNTPLLIAAGIMITSLVVSTIGGILVLVSEN